MGWVTGGEKELTQTIGRRVKVNQRQRGSLTLRGTSQTTALKKASKAVKKA